ncbi:Protein of unknown function (DUF2422) domain containing protein [Lactarius tabidus]|jgi:hypothetical protein
MSKPELPSTQSPETRDPGRASRASSLMHTVWDFIRPQPWVINNLRQRKSQQLLFRSWLPACGAIILILPNTSLRTIGNLAYFALLFSVFIPPMFPVQIYLVIVVQSLLGLVTGWAIGCAGMKAALAVRSNLYVEATLQNLGQSLGGSVNPDQLYKVVVFQGRFLDAKSSVIFGVFLAFGNMIFAIVRAYSPSLFFFSIFGTVATDIFCSIGPLYPFANYHILNSLLMAASAYCAMGLVCCFVFYPETVNHAYLGLISVILGKVKAMLMSQESLLSPSPGDFGPGSPKLKALAGDRAVLMTMYKSLKGLTFHLRSEFSYGRWGGDDVFGLTDPLLAVVSRLNGLLSFAKHLREVPSPPESFAYMLAPETVASDTHLLNHVFNPDVTRESSFKVTLAEALPHVRDATAELRAATIEAVASVQALINVVNTDRLFSGSVSTSQVEERLDASSEKLRAALDSFKEHGTETILGAYGHMPRGDMPLRSLYLGYVFGATTVIIGEVMLNLVQTASETSARRRRARLWGPSSLKHFVDSVLKGRRQNGEQAFSGEEHESFIDEDDQEPEYHPDPDSHPPTNSFQKFMHLLHHLMKWTKTVEAVFVFRYVLITILMWLPAVFKHSAHFFYVNKGIWALIMAQTIMSPYAGDQLYNYVIRLAGTALGLITALLIWYTGNGSGNGSPYGLAASYSVFILPVMFIRLFAPAKYLTGLVLGSVTVTLVVAYSWVDGHLPVISNPGIGWNVAWRRWTLVMIGCAGSFIVMMLPPKSGRKAVRLRTAKSIGALGNVYTSLMSAWITEGDAGKDVSFAATDWVKAFRGQLIAVTLQVVTEKQEMVTAAWEGNIRGRWPHAEYIKITEIEEDMIGVLSQLGGALWKLDTKWRLSLLHHTVVVDPNFISDIVSVFSSVSHSLRTGEPMHTVLPQTLLDRLVLHHQIGAVATPEFEGHGHRVIGPDETQSLDHMFYTSAVVAVYQLMECLDELHAVTRRLCGEVPFRGFERWNLMHKSRRGTSMVALSRPDTIIERELLISKEKVENVA